MKKELTLFATALVAVLVVSVCGCTVNTTNPSSSNQTSQAITGNQSSYLTDQFGKNYDVVSPFIKVSSNSTSAAYTGVVKDKSGTKYERNITINVVSDEASANALFAQLRQSYISQGYLAGSINKNRWFSVYDGGALTNYDTADKRIDVWVVDPSSSGVTAGSGNYDYSLGAWNVLTSIGNKTT